MKKFWVVLRSDTNSYSVSHDTKEKAVAEATRLARSYRGYSYSFLVLETVAEVVQGIPNNSEIPRVSI